MRRVLIAIAGLIFSPFVFAQVTTPTPTNPNILQAIQQVQTSINSLRSDLATVFTSISNSLSSIQAAIKGLTPAPVGNVLNTTLLRFVPNSGDQFASFTCDVTNTSSEARTVSMEFVNLVGQSSGPSTITLNPGASSEIGTSGASTNAGQTEVRCRFTVVNGTKNDIVAALTVKVTNHIPGTVIDTVSIPAR